MSFVRTHRLTVDSFLYQTGCWYTEDGQIIGVKCLSHISHCQFCAGDQIMITHYYRCLVVDVSRGIPMEITVRYDSRTMDSGAHFGPWLHERIQDRYLNCDYERPVDTTAAWDFEREIVKHKHHISLKKGDPA